MEQKKEANPSVSLLDSYLVLRANSYSVTISLFTFFEPIKA